MLNAGGLGLLNTLPDVTPVLLTVHVASIICSMQVMLHAGGFIGQTAGCDSAGSHALLLCKQRF